MWLPEKTRLLKVLLHNDGEDVETVWAEDLEPEGDTPRTKLVRLGNVPFLHAKPTYEDVIVAEHHDTYGWSWNRGGVTYEGIAGRLAEDRGRWAMIVDYRLLVPEEDLTSAFRRFDKTAEAADIAVEGAYADKEEGTGRAYLAVPHAYGVEEALRVFVDAELRLISDARASYVLAPARPDRLLAVGVALAG